MKDNIIPIILTLILLITCFIIGHRWESYEIKNQLEKNGYAISR